MKKQGLDYNKLRVRFKEELSNLTTEEIYEKLKNNAIDCINHCKIYIMPDDLSDEGKKEREWLLKYRGHFLVMKILH